jgi:hypothetical protein
VRTKVETWAIRFAVRNRYGTSDNGFNPGREGLVLIWTPARVRPRQLQVAGAISLSGIRCVDEELWPWPMGLLDPRSGPPRLPAHCVSQRNSRELPAAWEGRTGSRGNTGPHKREGFRQRIGVVGDPARLARVDVGASTNLAPGTFLVLPWSSNDGAKEHLLHIIDGLSESQSRKFTDTAPKPSSSQANAEVATLRHQ